MSNVAIYNPGRLDTPETPGERWHRKFLAGRSANTMRAYARDLEAFAKSNAAGRATRRT
jgi:hypothetical protein